MELIFHISLIEIKLLIAKCLENPSFSDYPNFLFKYLTQDLWGRYNPKSTQFDPTSQMPNTHTVNLCAERKSLECRF